MIDLNDLRANPEKYKQAAIKKRIKVDIDAFLSLDKELRELKVQVDTMRARQNAVSKEIPKLQGNEKQNLLSEMKELSAKLKDAENSLNGLEINWKATQLLLPGVPLACVPEGKDDSENVEIRKEGKIPEFSFKPLSHQEIGEKLGIIDSERGVKIAGSRNYFLCGDGARLHKAALNLAIDLLCAKGYRLMEPPHIVTYEAMMGTGYFPGGEEMAYHLDERDDKFLIGTSEVPVAAYHMNETLTKDQLPKRYVGYSPCYRREAGSYGKDTTGLYRVHQFYKIEQVIICENNAEVSAALHQEILGNAEEVLRLLELPYRVVDVCTGDMGQGQIYKNDIECWMPSRNAYGETHSCSTLHEFQARRLQLRYKDENGKSLYCHTLNNTCLASPRILIPLLEIHQNQDGTVNIPKALRPYMGGKDKIA